MRFNEYFDNNGKKYLVGDQIILGDECSTRIKGKIVSITENDFNIVVQEEETVGTGFKVAFTQVISPYSLTIKDNMYLKNGGNAECMDVVVRGTTLYVEKFTDNNR